jgi:cardiolipin synthase
LICQDSIENDPYQKNLIMKIRQRCRAWLDRHPALSRRAERVRRHRRMLTGILMLFAHLAGALTSIHAIMAVRTAQGAVAWAVSLNTFPYVAVPAYCIFGRSNFKGYVMARRKDAIEVDPIAKKFSEDLVRQKLIAFPDRERQMLVEKLAKLPFTRGNDAELLVNGDATFKSIFEGIDRATNYVLVQFYILRDDRVGRELKARLLGRARAGVRCAVLYDEVGNDLPRRYQEELRDGGVQVLPFNTRQGRANKLQINFRNHRKVVVVDGREAWVGGLNIGEEYKGQEPNVGYWRDTHVHLSGPVVECVQVAFLEDWHWASRETLTGLNWSPEPAASGTSRSVFCLPSGPADELETCTLFFLHAINLSKKRLWIATPYFVPDEQFISALQLAALRGVDVRILIPDKSDNILTQLSAWSYIESLEKVGIKVFRYTKGFLHQKVMLVDDEFCTVGTANFDNRSFRLNFEITVAVADEEFCGQVRKMLEEDFAQATVSTAAQLAARGFCFRFLTRASRLMAPVQ